MSTSSPEPLINLEEDDEEGSSDSRSTTPSKRRPPPPPPSSTKPRLIVRSNTGVGASAVNRQKQEPSPPRTKSPPVMSSSNIRKPLPPPKPSSRCVSMPPGTIDPAAIGLPTNGQDCPSLPDGEPPGSAGMDNRGRASPSKPLPPLPKFSPIPNKSVLPSKHPSPPALRAPIPVPKHPSPPTPPRKQPTPPTSLIKHPGPPAPPPRQPSPPTKQPNPPPKPKRLSSSLTMSLEDLVQPTIIQQSPPTPHDHNRIAINGEGLLINLAPDSPEGDAIVPVCTSPTRSMSVSKRAQTLCLPKPAARELEYEERDHSRTVFKQLNVMREKGELCDAILTVDEQEIPAHRIVLAANSPYFHSMFVGEFAEPEGEPIVIEEVDEDSLIALVEFAYTSKIKLTHSNVYSLFEAADVLQFSGVRNACFRFFKSQMNKTNCIRTWLFAETHNCIELIEASRKFIEVNFLDIVRGQEFLAVETDTACSILSLEDIAISCEEQVYEAALSWISTDIDDRRSYAHQILSEVRFSSISREYLMHIVDHEPVIRDDPDCLQLAISALESHVANERGTLAKKKQGSKAVPRAASMAVEEIVINKSNCSLGVGIMGGYDRPTHIFRQGDKPGIFIRQIMPGGAAEKSGKLRTGDRILSINGNDVTRCHHDTAIKLLVTSKDRLVLLVRHEPPPAGLKEVTLVTRPGGGFGFSIAGGVNGYSANPWDETDEGIFISQIIAGGAAEQDGRLLVGTRILQVNSVSVLGKTLDEAKQTLQGVLDRMSLLVCHGYSPSATPSQSDSVSLGSWGDGVESIGSGGDWSSSNGHINTNQVLRPVTVPPAMNIVN